MTPHRCTWAHRCAEEMHYHDTEWGVPVHDERTLFEFVILDGAHGGISCKTIIKKRPHYRAVYDNFEPALVARYDEQKKHALLNDAGIVRNRLKIDASIDNAKAFLKVQDEFGSFDAYIWRCVDGAPIHNAWATHKDIPASTPISDAMSKDLKKRGFRFVGSTICYAMMQAIGMVNDHTTDCFRYQELCA
jgi:DNA-3-methyladenine glycosylase I